MGACTGSLKVNASVAFICGFSGKTKYAAHRFVSSGFLCGESCGYIEVGMMISETVSHFFHIKVTAGSIRRGGGGGGSGGGGGGSVPSFLWKTLDYLAFTSASGGWNSLSAEQERVAEPAAARSVSSEEEDC